MQGRGCYPIGVARLPHPIIHLPATFPVNFWRKAVNHAALYPNHAGVQAEARDAARKLAEYEAGTLPPLPGKPPFPLPALIAPLFGSPEYRIRPELLD